MSRHALRVTASASAVAAALAALSAAGAAAAQAATPPPAPPAQSQAATPDAQGTAPVVTVTAERRTINLQTAPIPATVLAGKGLQDAGIYTVDDLQFHTPSLTVTNDGGSVLFNIRGLGKDLNNVQTPSGVVTYWDGVATFPGFFQDAPYYDIANVEVLRGPQGTFGGQNADAGAIFITTNDPHLGSWSGDLEGQVGSYNDYLGRGDVNIPLGDTFAARIAFNTESRSSFYHIAGPWDSVTGKTPGSYDDASFRLSVLWEPNSAFKAVLKYDFTYINYSGVPVDPSLALNLAAPPLFVVPNPGSLFNITDYTHTYAQEQMQRLTLNASYTFGNGIVLRSISGYEYGWGGEDVDLAVFGFGTGPFGGPPYLDSFADWGREAIYSEEVNLISPDMAGPLHWLAGLYYQHDEVTLEPGGGNSGFDIGVPSGVFDENLHYRTPKITEAAFGQIGYDITQALKLQVSARYTDESFGLSDTLYNTLFGAVIPSSVFNYNAKTDNSAVTGKATLNWKLDANNFLYAFISTGSKAAGINSNPVGSQVGPVPFAPETVTDYEVGWNPTFFDGHMKAQIDAYYDQYKNFQLSFAVPGTVGGQSFIRNLGGTTTLYGLEAAMQAVFGPLSLDATGSYEHSSLGSYSLNDPGPSLTTGHLVNIGGRVAPLAPEWTFSAGAQYAFALPNGVTLTPRVDYSYISSQWATPYQDVGDFLQSRSLVNAELALAYGNYKLTVYGTNAFNERYLIGVYGGVRYAGPPAQYGVRLDAKF